MPAAQEGREQPLLTLREKAELRAIVDKDEWFAMLLEECKLRRSFFFQVGIFWRCFFKLACCFSNDLIGILSEGREGPPWPCHNPPVLSVLVGFVSCASDKDETVRSQARTRACGVSNRRTPTRRCSSATKRSSCGRLCSSCGTWNRNLLSSLTASAL